MTPTPEDFLYWFTYPLPSGEASARYVDLWEAGKVRVLEIVKSGLTNPAYTDAVRAVRQEVFNAALEVQ